MPDGFMPYTRTHLRLTTDPVQQLALTKKVYILVFPQENNLTILVFPGIKGVG